MKRSFYLTGALGAVALAAVMFRQDERQLNPPIVSQQSNATGDHVQHAHALRAAQHNDDQLVRSEVWELTKPVQSPPIIATIPNVDRFHYLASLKGELTEDEIDELCRFVEDVPAVKDMNEQLLALLNNEILNRLSKEKTSGARVQSALLSVQANSAQPAVMRDYAIQHLGLRYEAGYPDQEASRRAFWDRVDEDFVTVGGTALLALHRIALRDLLPAEEKQLLTEKATASLKRVGATDPSRMASLEILRHNKVPEGLLAARKILSGRESTPLTIAAVAAIGDLGAIEDVALLRKPQLAADPRYASVASNALAKLSKNPL